MCQEALKWVPQVTMQDAILWKPSSYCYCWREQSDDEPLPCFPLPQIIIFYMSVAEKIHAQEHPVMKGRKSCSLNTVMTKRPLAVESWEMIRLCFVHNAFPEFPLPNCQAVIHCQPLDYSDNELWQGCVIKDRYFMPKKTLKIQFFSLQSPKENVIRLNSL